MKYFILILLISTLCSGASLNIYLPLYSHYTPEIQEHISKRISTLGKNYRPRTEHLNTDGSAIYVNDLIFEESPYLLQHAHNPVNWHAWTPKAFQLAQTQNKPIFLSIGYATCHWCHVMEHESFENLEIAQFINENFIAIKVDRERRTAIDAYYMMGVQMMTGHGGWPMSNFLTPDAKPFFGGTYYNPNQFKTLLERVNEAWNTQETELRKQAQQMDEAINKYLAKSLQAAKINESVYKTVNESILSRYDEILGGFTSAPKFPQEPWLLYLLAEPQKEFNKALQFSLNSMKQGGIYDQIGGGFHRYATDNEWLTPHFEKMLYNQSQLGEVYTQAAQEFNNPEYKRTALEIYNYILAEMTSDEGAFFSASDADSEGTEGLFYTWTDTELKTALNTDEYNWLKNIYHFSSDGNFEGRNILFLSETLTESAKKLNIPYSQIINKLDGLNRKLYQIRKSRIHPLIDNKIITSWNAQMVYSLANASMVFNKPEYMQAAIKAMNYLLNTHVNHQKLVRNSLNDKASTIQAELEDYAWMITALIKLYDIDANEKWLKQASTLIKLTENLFYDTEKGGFFDNIPEAGIPNNSRIKHSEDGAIVSANGQMLIALARHYRRTGDLHIDELFTQSLAAFSGQVVQNPLSHTTLLRAKEIMAHGEKSNLAYTGNGHVKISTIRNNDKIIIKFKINKDWHVNSNQTAIESLIPMKIESKENFKFTYPQPKSTHLEFNQSELSTFAGDFEVTTTVAENKTSPIALTIQLQTCSNKICLAPSKVIMMVY